MSLLPTLSTPKRQQSKRTPKYYHTLTINKHVVLQATGSQGHEDPEGLLKHKLLGPISRISGPGKACGCAFLANSQVTPMLLIQGHALRATGIGRSGGSADLS